MGPKYLGPLFGPAAVFIIAASHNTKVWSSKLGVQSLEGENVSITYIVADLYP